MFMTHNQVVAGSSHSVEFDLKTWSPMVSQHVGTGSFNSTKMYVSDLFDYWD